MLKVRCNSQEGIIDFIESSEQYGLVKKHFNNCLIESHFEVELKKLSALSINKKSVYVIIDQKNCRHNTKFISRLEKHLKLAGIQTVDNTTVKLENIEDITPLIFLLCDEENTNISPRELLDAHCISINSENNYYLLVFKILKKVFSEDIIIDKFIFQFKNQCEKFSDEFVFTHVEEKSTLENTRENESNLNEVIIKQIPFFNFIKKHRKPIFLYCMPSLIFIGFIFILLIQNNTTKKSTWNLPRQDHVFVGRENLLTALKHGLHPSSNNSLKKDSDMLVINAYAGLGGIGKTQLALQYIHHSTHPYKLRAWFFSENVDQLNHQYIEFAKYLGYKGDSQSIKLIITYIKEWLSLHPGWFLVYDNVNNYEEIEPYLPGKGGHVLITTRSQIWPSKVKSLPIDIMTEKESIDLVKHLTYCTTKCKDDQEIKALVKTLGYLPLAMAQASAYIHHNQISISEYLNLYQNHAHILLTDNNLPIGTRNLPIATTWNITLENLFKDSGNSEERLLALDLLTVCSYLAPEEISRSLLLAWLKEAYPKVNTPELVLSKLIGELWKYSVIRVGETGNITVHRLVQTVLRSQHLNREKSPYPKMIPAWYGTLLKAAHAEYSKNIQASEDEFRRKNLLPHLQALVTNYDAIWSDQNPEPFLAAIIQDIGKTFDDIMGAFKTAKPYYERVLKLERKLYGKSHPKVAIALKDLGKTYRHLREYETSKILLEQSLKINEEIFGKNHANIGEVLIILGHTYRNLDFTDKSLEVLDRALKINEQVYGKEHLQVAFNLSILGITHTGLKDYTKALAIFQRAYKIYEKEYGTDHRAIAHVVGNMGDAYRGLGDFKQAQNLLERRLKIYEQAYGKEHSYIAVTLTILGHIFEGQKKFKKSQEYFERALKMDEKEFGVDHIQLLDSLLGLGSTCRRLKNYRQSLFVLERALRISEKAYGKKHIVTAKLLKNLAATYQDLGELKKAEEYTEQARNAAK